MEPLTNAGGGSEGAPGPPPHVAHRRLQVACNLSMVVFAASIAVPSVCLPDIGGEFGLSLADRGLAASLRTGALLAALLASGYLADRYGKGRFLSVGMLLTALGTAGTAMAGRFASLLGAQAVAGLGTGSMEALVNPLVAELHPESPARPLNITNGLFSVGLVIASLLAGEMLQAGLPWRMTPWVWVAPPIIAAALFATRRYPGPLHGQTADRGTAFLRQRLFWMLMAAMVLAGGAEAGMTFWGASFMEQELGASVRTGAVTLAFYGACMAAGRFASGGLVARVGSLSLTTGSAAACALSTAGLCFTHAPLGAWVLFGLGGLFVACFWPTLLSVASDHIATGSTSLFSLLAAAGVSGCVIVPWAIGRLADAFDLRTAVLIHPALMVLLIAVLVVAMRLIGREPGPEPSAEGRRFPEDESPARPPAVL